MLDSTSWNFFGHFSAQPQPVGGLWQKLKGRLNCKLKLFIVPKAFKVREKAGPEPQLMYLQSDHLCICKDNLSQFEHSPTVPLFGKSTTMADLQFVALDLGRIEFWVRKFFSFG